MKLKLDLTQSGLPMVFKEYEIIMLRHLWKEENLPPDKVPTFRPKTYGSNSSTLTTVVNRKMVERYGERPGGRWHASRASVIKAGSRFAELEIWDYYEKTGKGGYQKVYHAKMTEVDLRQAIKDLVLENL